MCYRPIVLKKREAIVPCNKCPKCIKRRVSAWSFRLMQQELVSSSAHFITFTYATENMPFTSNGYPTCTKRDLQLFFKRLRKADRTPNIKYYAVGEYGGKTKRPHYHALLFNADVNKVDSAWGLGHIYCGSVTGASIGYTLKYMSKNKRAFKLSSGDDRVPEFALMSKGLGANYLTEEMIQWHAIDLENRMYCTTYDGIKLSMPRYYKDKLYSDEERRAIANAYAILQTDEMLEKLSKQTLREFRNEQAAIDAAFDKMYRSSLKTCI